MEGEGVSQKRTKVDKGERVKNCYFFVDVFCA